MSFLYEGFKDSYNYTLQPNPEMLVTFCNRFNKWVKQKLHRIEKIGLIIKLRHIEKRPFKVEIEEKTVHIKTDKGSEVPVMREVAGGAIEPETKRVNDKRIRTPFEYLDLLCEPKRNQIFARYKFPSSEVKHLGFEFPKIEELPQIFERDPSYLPSKGAIYIHFLRHTHMMTPIQTGELTFAMDFGIITFELKIWIEIHSHKGE